MTLPLPDPDIRDGSTRQSIESAQRNFEAIAKAFPVQTENIATGAGASGPAGGDLTGTYPNPGIAAGAIVNADVNASAAIAESKLALASDAAAATPSRRTLGTGATQAAAGNDSRLSDARTPTGAAGGDLSGTYPNPQIATGAIVNADVNASAAIAQSKIASLTTDLAAKAPLASPTFTGDPKAPTPTAGDNDTSIATTAFVTAANSTASTADRARANHTGTQLASTISDFSTTSRNESKAGDGLSRTTDTLAVDSTVARRNADNDVTGYIRAAGSHSGGASVRGENTNTGIGSFGVQGVASGASGVIIGVRGEALTSTSGTGVMGVSVGVGVLGSSSGSGAGVRGRSDSGPAFQVTSDHGTGAAFDANSEGKIINVLDPTAAQDAATKNYIDTRNFGKVHMAEYCSIPATVAAVVGTDYIVFIKIPSTQLVTGLTAAVAASAGSCRGAIYSSDGATRHATRSTDHTVASGFGAPHRMPFDSSVTLPAGLYLIMLTFSSASCTLQQNVANDYAGAVAGTYVAPPTTVTVPSAFGQVPIMGVY